MDQISGSAPASLLVTTVLAADDQLSDVSGVDPTFLSVSEKRQLLLGLMGMRKRVEGLLVETLAVSADVADAEGARSAGAWLAAATHEERPVMGRLQRLATEALEHRLVREALRAGAMSTRQADAIVQALEGFGSSVPAELAAEAERHLVGLAADFDATELRRLGAGILEILDPDTFEDHERARLEDELRRAREVTRLSIRPSGDGTARISGVLPESVAARLKTYLNAFSSPRHDAAATDGSDPSPYVDPATGRRVRGDRVLGEAFCAFLEAADPQRMPIHGGAATTVIVTMDFDKLRAETGIAATGSDRLTAGEIRRLACNASIIPAVLGGKSELLDLGRTRRLFSPAQRKALAWSCPGLVDTVF